MIYNQKCDDCVFGVKCVAKNKLKPFSEDAKVDLGVELKFIGCTDFIDVNQADEQPSYTGESEAAE